MRRVTSPLALIALFALLGGRADAARPALALVNATARAEGNARATAVRIGEAIFARSWNAQVLHVEANVHAAHLVVGLMLSGVKFHAGTTRDAFLDEIAALAAVTFAHSTAEEADIWAAVPIPVAKGTIVSGDLAQPTDRTVFAVSVRRGESAAALTRRLRSQTNLFLDQEWAHRAFKPSRQRV